MVVSEAMTGCSMDLGRAGQSGANMYLPNASGSFDPFHLIKLANEAVDTVRWARRLACPWEALILLAIPGPPRLPRGGTRLRLQDRKRERRRRSAGRAPWMARVDPVPSHSAPCDHVTGFPPPREGRTCGLIRVFLARGAFRHPPAAGASGQTLSTRLIEVGQERRRLGYRWLDDLLLPEATRSVTVIYFSHGIGLSKQAGLPEGTLGSQRALTATTAPLRVSREP